MKDLSIKEVPGSHTTPLSRSVEWATEFLNDLGGDYSILNITENQITLANQCSCPGFCSRDKIANTAACNDIEKAICKAIKLFDPDLSAGFIKCSSDEGSRCEISIRVSC